MIVRWAAWSFGSAVLAGLALRVAVGDAIFLGRYTGYVMPWLLAGLVPGALWAARTRRPGLAALFGVCAVTILALHAPRFWPRSAPEPPPSGLTLRVMSFNTWSKNGDVLRMATLIRREAPDVLLLQEIPPDVFARLAEVLGELDRGLVHSSYEAAILQGVVSRYPVEPRWARKDKGQAQKVIVRSPAGPVAVFNVHPLRGGGWRHRYGQVAALLEEEVLREASPVILGGDLNANEHTELYRLLASRLRNAHDEAGFGLGFTWPSPAVLLGAPVPPLVRIDHVFFSDHFVAVRAGTVDDAGGSDHHPVIAEVMLKEARPDLLTPDQTPSERRGHRPRAPARAASEPASAYNTPHAATGER